MDGKQQQHVVNIEQNKAEQVTGKPWSLWKTFLVSVLACLIATSLVVLVLYFIHFGKPTSDTTIIIHADGKSCRVNCLPGPTPSLAPPGPQYIPPDTPVINQSSSTKVSTSAATQRHEVVVE